MIFWMGILVGGFFAYFAVKIGFYETLVMLFNIIISVYLAVYLRPIIVNVPAVRDTPYCNALTMIGTAIAAFLVLHGISYTFLTGQFSIPFPRVLDTLGAAFLGFLAGFLVWSLVSLVVCTAPISQNAFVKGMGFDNERFEQTNASYLYWWCDLVNTVVSDRGKGYTTEQAVSELLRSIEKKTQPKATKRAEPTEPGEVETSIEEQIDPPPEIDFEDI